MSTKDYLDSKWPDLHSQPTIEKPITEVNEIDEDKRNRLDNYKNKNLIKVFKMYYLKKLIYSDID